MSFQLSISAFVFVLFALLFPLCIPLCAPNLQTNQFQLFVQISPSAEYLLASNKNGFLRKKATCQVSWPSCRALISMAAGFLAKKSQPPHI